MAASAEKLSFSPNMEQKLSIGVERGDLSGIHSVLIGHRGELVLEKYYQGADESWEKVLGIISFEPETLHDVRSVTKSVVGILYGIALDRGFVPAPDAPLLSQFPEYPDLASDPDRAKLTVEHALNMTLGMRWDEQKPYTDPENDEIGMEFAKDRYRFVLERPFVAKPGERWIYSGGSVALIGALIERGTGKTLPEFAREALFDPLGITQIEWMAGEDGTASAASGLRLRGRDLLRIGFLILANGEWQGQRIVSRSWLEDSLKPAVPTGDGLHYGRLWYLGETSIPTLPGGKHRWIAAFGNGGQRLWLIPDAGVAIVTFAGNYNKRNAGAAPGYVWSKVVLASLQSA